MPENFKNDYDAYFKALEQSLNKSNTDKNTVEKQTENSGPSPKKANKGFYKVCRLRKSAIAVILAVVILAVSLIAIIPSGDDKTEKTKSNPSGGITATDDKQNKISKTEFTVSDQTVAIPQTNDAKTAIIVDRKTGEIVAERNPHERAFPASTTKIMTLLTAVENITDWSGTFTMTYEITDPLYVEEASVAGFLNNEVVSINDLLYGTILPSGADAAMGLAIHLAGSEEEFVKLMNKKVAELGLENTHFDNVTGLHSANNYSTAYDMAIILDAALKNDLCKEILSTYQHTTAKTPQNPNGILLSSTLFSHMYGTEPETATILGGKTGFVNESGYCIASYGTNNENGNEYLVVTLGNSSRWPAFYGQIDLYKEFAK